MSTDIAEPEEEPEYWFKYSATLRIFGDIGDLDTITSALVIAPTHTHRRGERRRPTSPRCYEHDM